MSRKLAPVHPGEVLRADFLGPMKLSPYAVARACGVPRTESNASPARKHRSRPIRRCGSRNTFGTTPAFWMGMQAQYDLEHAADEAAAEIRAIRPVKAA